MNSSNVRYICTYIKEVCLLEQMDGFWARRATCQPRRVRDKLHHKRVKLCCSTRRTYTNFNSTLTIPTTGTQQTNNFSMASDSGHSFNHAYVQLIQQMARQLRVTQGDTRDNAQPRTKRGIKADTESAETLYIDCAQSGQVDRVQEP